MYDFFTRNALYLVLVIALVVWLGISWYLSRLDARLERLEQRMSDSTNDSKGLKS